MNAQLQTPAKQHDFAYYECSYPRALQNFEPVDRHTLAILRDAFQRILDDDSDTDSLLERYAHRSDESLGLLLRVAINDAALRYVHAHIAELEADDAGKDAA